MNWAWRVGSVRGVAIVVHATTLLGVVVFSGLTFAPARWACTLALIFLHEVGHALAVVWAGGRPTEIALTGFGGHCRWQGNPTALGRAGIAAGGVAAQLVVLITVHIAERLGFVPLRPLALEVWWCLTFSNAFLIAFNLLPFAPLDGAEAWRFPFELGRRLRAGRPPRARPSSTSPADSVAMTKEAQARAMVEQLLEAASRPAADDGEDER